MHECAWTHGIIQTVLLKAVKAVQRSDATLKATRHVEGGTHLEEPLEASASSTVVNLALSATQAIPGAKHKASPRSPPELSNQLGLTRPVACDAGADFCLSSLWWEETFKPKKMSQDTSMNEAKNVNNIQALKQNVKKRKSKKQIEKKNKQI